MRMRDGSRFRVCPAELLFVVHEMTEFLGWLPGVIKKEVKSMCMPPALIPYSVFVCDVKLYFLN